MHSPDPVAIQPPQRLLLRTWIHWVLIGLTMFIAGCFVATLVWLVIHTIVLNARWEVWAYNYTYDSTVEQLAWDVLGTACGGLIGGGVIALVGWFFLGSIIPDTARIAWFLLNMGGMMIVLLTLFAISVWNRNTDPSPLELLGLLVLLPAGAGSFMGWAQWIILRRKLQHATWWICAMSSSLVGAMVFWWSVAMLFLPRD